MPRLGVVRPAPLDRGVTTVAPGMEQEYYSTAMGLHGLRVVAFESRLADAMRALITQHGGEPLVAPALREIALEENREALAFAERLFAGQVDVLICLTGVGTRTLAAAISTRYPREQLRDALSRITVVARGPKPVKALTELGVAGFLAVPEPNTWQEILALLDAQVPIRNRRVTVQEYGISNEPFLQALRERGAHVSRVPVYRWALPEDTRPLREALRAIVDGQVDVACFTNAAQVEHMQQVATEEQLAEPLQQAFQRIVVASVGPISSQALRRYGYPVDFEPSHPKMGVLVKETMAHAEALLHRKRAQRL